MFDIKLIIKLEINYPALGSHFFSWTQAHAEIQSKLCASSTPLCSFSWNSSLQYPAEGREHTEKKKVKEE